MSSFKLNRPLLIVLGVLGAATFAACGSGDDSMFGGPGSSGGNGDGGSTKFVPGGSYGDGGPLAADVASLAFDPPTANLTLDGVNPQTASFRLRATLKAGGTVDVWPTSLQFDRPDIASAVNGSPVVLTAAGAFGGTGKLHGIYGGMEAVADLTVNVVRKDIAAGLPANIVSALDSPNPVGEPSPWITKILYPYDKTVFPQGLTSPLMMWTSPTANDVYKIHFEQATYTYDRYIAVTPKAQVRIDQAMWDRITGSNTGDDLKVTFTRYSKADKKPYAAGSISWKIAPASLRGAIYYWTAKKLDNVESGKIVRLPVGSGATPTTMSTGIAGQTCMGCHAVSADGSTLAASVAAAPTGDHTTYAYTNGWLNGRGWAAFDLPSGTVRKQTKMAGNNLALTPDGKYTVFGGRFQTDAQANGVPETWQPGSKYLTLADTATGTIVTDSGLDDLVLTAGQYGLSMPAFAPDGKKLAAVEFSYADNKEIRDNIIPDSNQILVFGFDQGTLKFTATPARLPLASFAPHDNSGIGYPSFTPDAKFVAYHVGNHSTGCWTGSGCDDTVQHRGELYLQASDGSGNPIRLTALDDPPATADRDVSVEPTFNPAARGNYSWVVFTSMRDWGNRLTGTANNGKRRLWVAAIDANGGADPSHPAFYLDGQEETPNMRGFWTLAACTPTAPPGSGGGKCSAGFECCSGFCDNGVCVDVSKVSCAGTGGSCASLDECCNPSVVTCTDSKCTPKAVK